MREREETGAYSEETRRELDEITEALRQKGPPRPANAPNKEK
jgi:hypothetical protein